MISPSTARGSIARRSRTRAYRARSIPLRYLRILARWWTRMRRVRLLWMSWGVTTRWLQILRIFIVARAAEDKIVRFDRNRKGYRNVPCTSDRPVSFGLSGSENSAIHLLRFSYATPFALALLRLVIRASWAAFVRDRVSSKFESVGLIALRSWLDVRLNRLMALKWGSSRKSICFSSSPIPKLCCRGRINGVSGGAVSSMRGRGSSSSGLTRTRARSQDSHLASSPGATPSTGWGLVCSSCSARTRERSVLRDLATRARRLRYDSDAGVDVWKGDERAGSIKICEYIGRV